MASSFTKNQSGFVALMTVLIILAITLIIGISLGLSSISEMKMSLQKSQSSAAYYLTNLCAEYALMKLKEDSGYAGNEATTTENGSCQVLPIEGSPPWTIKVSATSSNQVKKMKIIISQINPEMIIDSWQEIAEF